MKLLINNLLDTTTLSYTTGTIEDELPLDNLKKVSRSRVMRSTTEGTLVIEGVLAGAKLITGFIIGGHNFLVDVTYELKLYNSSDLSGTPVTYTESGIHTIVTEQAATDLDNFQYNIPIWIDNTSSIGSFSLTLFSNIGLSYFQMNRIFIGEVVETNVGASIGHNIYWKEATKQYRTEAGTLRSDNITPRKVIEFNLNAIYEQERSNLQRSLASIGMRDEFYFSLFPGDCFSDKESNYSGIMKLTKVPRYTEFANNFYNAKFVVEEV